MTMTLNKKLNPNSSIGSANRFEVDTKGMAELQSGREPWQLLKELVSNAWDEKITVCEVNILNLGGNRTRVTVYDDGRGFKDIADAWTLMKHTGKRSNPNVRGRFNLGDKELISVAIDAVICTSGKRISFPEEGGRYCETFPCKGTEVRATMPWTRKEAEETVVALRKLLPPKGVKYTVNGVDVKYRAPEKTIEWTLETQIADSMPGAPLRRTYRKTQIQIIRSTEGWLYEMGVPIQPIDCPYIVDIQQKVPMPPNRDVVRDSYLKDVYAAVLTSMVDELEYTGDSGKSWVRQAVGAKDVPDEVVTKVLKARYGGKVMLWSSDMKANEKASQEGYEVINSRSLDIEERRAFERVGLVHTSDQFATPMGGPDSPGEDYVSEDKWTPGMIRLANFAKTVATPLVGQNINVKIYRFLTGAAADYAPWDHTLRFNLVRLGHAFFDESIADGQIGLIAHEIAHEEGNWHNWKYLKNFQAITGKAVMLALQHPEYFKLVDLK